MNECEILIENTLHYNIEFEHGYRKKHATLNNIKLTNEIANIDEIYKLKNIFSNITDRHKYYLYALELSGHAFGIFIEIKESDKFNLYILNSGKGIENHTTYDNSKIKYIEKNNVLLAPSIMCFENINKSILEEIYQIYNNIYFNNTFEEFYSKIKNICKGKNITQKFIYNELQGPHNCSLYLFILAFKLLLNFYGITDELIFIKILNILRLYLVREEYFRLKFVYRYLELCAF
jgi:hypothetical protein